MRSTLAPKVSILTPVYNTNPQHLRECIESILNQTFTDFEFIILNDSPNNTEIEKIVKSYKDQRIKYYKNEKNIGISDSRNKLLDLAQGEYIAIFDHDDISLPTRLEQEVKVLDENPEIGIVGGWIQFFGTKHMLWDNPEYDIDIRVKMTHTSALFHTTAMIRKSVLTNNKIQYENYYTPAEDYQLYARLLSVTKFYNIQEILVMYRWTGNNTTVTMGHKMSVAIRDISMQLCNQYPAYAALYNRNYAVRRYKLFGFIPLIKIKKRRILLFNFIPLIKIKG